MRSVIEQNAYFKFCFGNEISATETFEILQTVLKTTVYENLRGEAKPNRPRQRHSKIIESNDCFLCWPRCCGLWIPNNLPDSQ